MSATIKDIEEIRAFEQWTKETFGYSMEAACINADRVCKDTRQEVQDFVGKCSVNPEQALKIWNRLQGHEMKTIGRVSFFNPNDFLVVCADILDL